LTVDKMLEYLAAFVIFGHGIGHLTGPLFSYGVEIGGMSDRPWLISQTQMMRGKVGRAWSVFWIAALALFVVSSVGAFMSEIWWREWAVFGAFVSIAAMAPWWNSILVGAKAGILLNIAILLLVPLSWRQGIVELFGLP
jgi:hypothetical protein